MVGLKKKKGKKEKEWGNFVTVLHITTKLFCLSQTKP